MQARSNQRFLLKTVVYWVVQGDKKTGLARAQRRNMTAAEKVLWSQLRARRFHGLIFYRQAPIGPFIADFYCPVARVVVEADGSYHLPERDQKRDQYMTELGISVLRFRNENILYARDRVMGEIFAACVGSIGGLDAKSDSDFTNQNP